MAKISVPVVEERIISSYAELAQAGEEIDYPVALKGNLPGVVHKSEMGLVHLNITGPKALEEAFRKTSWKMKGQGRILLQHMVKCECELITMSATYRRIQGMDRAGP